MSRLLYVSILLGALGSTGCGLISFNKPESAADPDGADAPAQGEASVAPGAASQDPSNAQDGTTAAASSGEPGTQPAAPKATGPKRAPRPKMSAAATQAFDAGKKAFAQGDLQGARSQYRKSTKSDAKAYLAHYSLGVVSERLGAEGDAVKSYRQALRVVPDHEPSAVALSVLLARQRNYEGALSAIQKVASKLPNSAPLLAAKAEVKSMQGQSGEAQRLAQQALKVDPNYKPAMVVLARDHYRARRIDLALYALTGILDGYGEGNPPRDKNNAEARLIRGLIYSERSMKGPAMEEMESALAARPDLVDAHLVLATYMMEAGNASGARGHLEKAIRFDNKNVAAHLQLGDAYRLLDRPEDAKRELEWVLAAEPNQAAAHYNLALLFLLSSKMKGVTRGQAIDKAIEHLEAYKARAVRGGPDDVDDLMTRAKTQKALLAADAGGAG